MNTINRIILWLLLLFACFVPASALALAASENYVWEIFTVGYDAAVPESIVVYDSLARPASAYDEAPNHRAGEEKRSFKGGRVLFGPNAEFKAAEGGTAALQPMADAAFQTGTIRNVAGYELGGNAGLVRNTYNVNLWGLYATENSQGPFALINALKGEASAAGARQISITGNAVVNQSLLNISPGVASRLGFQFRQINPTTILLQGAVH
jgi:hypothetical protein